MSSGPGPAGETKERPRPPPWVSSPVPSALPFSGSPVCAAAGGCPGAGAVPGAGGAPAPLLRICPRTSPARAVPAPRGCGRPERCLSRVSDPQQLFWCCSLRKHLPCPQALRGFAQPQPRRAARPRSAVLPPKPNLPCSRPTAFACVCGAGAWPGMCRTRSLRKDRFFCLVPRARGRCFILLWRSVASDSSFRSSGNTALCRPALVPALRGAEAVRWLQFTFFKMPGGSGPWRLLTLRAGA